MNWNRNAWMALGVMLLASGGALGQSEAPKDEDALKGPQVDKGAPGSRKFGSKSGNPNREAQVNLRTINRALGVLRSEEAGENRLTADQEAELKTAMETFRKDVETFHASHQSEIRSLMEKMTPKDRRTVMARMQAAGINAGKGERGEGRPGGKGQPPADLQDGMQDGMQEADDAASKAAMTELRKLMEGAPKPADVQVKVWKTLTEAQQGVLKKEMERLAKEGREGADAAMNNPRLPAELREKLANMSPEERREAIRKYREENAKNKNEKGGSGKAPPPMDDVKVPDPER